jgi:hypothetical protein
MKIFLRLHQGSLIYAIRPRPMNSLHSLGYGFGDLDAVGSSE